MLNVVHSSIPSLPPKILTTIPTLTSIFARTFLTSSNRQEAAVPKKNEFLTKGRLKKLGLDESLLPPKKPAAAFTSFFVDFKKSHTTPKPVLELAKEAGKAWRGMSDAEKKVYLDRATKEFAEYRTKYQEWVNGVHPSVITKINNLMRQTGKRAVNNVRSDGINKPTSPYNQFSKEFYKKYTEEHGPISGKESFSAYVKRSAEAWKNISETERDVYRERYQKEMTEYSPKIDKLELKTANSGTQKPSTPYLMFKDNFQKKYIKEHGEVSRKELLQLTKGAWKKLSAAKKNLYMKRYETKKTEYLAEMDKIKLN